MLAAGRKIAERDAEALRAVGLMTNAESAIAQLRAVGFVVDDPNGYPMRKVRRTATDTAFATDMAFVWLDTGDTVGVLGDAFDKDDALYLDVIELLDGAEARARAERLRNS